MSNQFCFACVTGKGNAKQKIEFIRVFYLFRFNELWLIKFCINYFMLMRKSEAMRKFSALGSEFLFAHISISHKNEY